MLFSFADCTVGNELNLINSKLPKFISMEIHRDTSYPDTFVFPLIKANISPFDVVGDSLIALKLTEEVVKTYNEWMNNDDKSISMLHPVLARKGQTQQYRNRVSKFYPVGVLMNSISLAENRIDRGTAHFEDGGASLNNTILRLMNSSDFIPEQRVSCMTQSVLRALLPTPVRSQKKLYIGKMNTSEINMNIWAFFDFQGAFNFIKKSDTNILYQRNTVVNRGLAALSLCANFFAQFVFSVFPPVLAQCESRHLFGNVDDILQLHLRSVISKSLKSLTSISLVQIVQAMVRGIRSSSLRSLYFLFKTIHLSASNFKRLLVKTGFVTSTESPCFKQLKLLLPRNIFEGLTQGLLGLYQYPRYFGQNHGILGVFKGIFRGTGELFMKPFYGCLNTLSTTSLMFSVTLLKKIGTGRQRRMRRFRLPRIFEDPAAPLKEYRDEVCVDAQAELLSRICDGDYADEGYLWHCYLPDSTILILTYSRILVVGGSAIDYCDLHWTFLWSEIIELSQTFHNSIQAINQKNIIQKSVSIKLTQSSEMPKRYIKFLCIIYSLLFV